MFLLVLEKPVKGYKLIKKGYERLYLETRVSKLNNLSITRPAIEFKEFIGQ